MDKLFLALYSGTRVSHDDRPGWREGLRSLTCLFPWASLSVVLGGAFSLPGVVRGPRDGHPPWPWFIGKVAL